LFGWAFGEKLKQISAITFFSAKFIGHGFDLSAHGWAGIKFKVKLMCKIHHFPVVIG
jgi:hypothetical protein